MELGRANLDVFADTLLECAKQDRNVLIVTSDSRGSAKLTRFGQELPAQLIEVGIAEQNLVGIAAGLASCDKKVFAVSPACFLTARGLEQIKNDIAYSNQPVKVIGISAGVSYGALGTTHHSLHDYAVLRAIHNMTIIAPADNFETRQAILAVLDYPYPVYVRFGKAPQVHLHPPGTTFVIGKAIQIRDGYDLTYIGCGETVSVALAAAQLLAEAGVSCRVLSMHTLKPLDQDALVKAAQETRAMITVEEHSVYGGLGEACAAVLMQRGLALSFQIVAIPDEHTVTGSQTDIFNHYGISPTALTAMGRQLLAAQGVRQK